jgi:hypothetical protein
MTDSAGLSLQQFFFVDDCQSCVSGTFDNTNTAMKSTCRYCDDNGSCKSSVFNGKSAVSRWRLKSAVI